MIVPDDASGSFVHSAFSFLYFFLLIVDFCPETSYDKGIIPKEDAKMPRKNTRNTKGRIISAAWKLF